MQEQRQLKKQGFKMQIFSSLIKLLFILLLLNISVYAIELNWGNDYDEALLQAQKEKKLIYLFIGADRCKHCERFKKQTLSNKALVAKMKEDYILIYMSRDQHFIPDKFEVYGAPRHYFLSAQGDIIADGQGSRELEGWYDILDEVELMQEQE